MAQNTADTTPEYASLPDIPTRTLEDELNGWHIVRFRPEDGDVGDCVCKLWIGQWGGIFVYRSHTNEQQRVYETHEGAIGAFQGAVESTADDRYRADRQDRDWVVVYDVGGGNPIEFTTDASVERVDG